MREDINGHRLRAANPCPSMWHSHAYTSVQSIITPPLRCTLNPANAISLSLSLYIYIYIYIYIIVSGRASRRVASHSVALHRMRGEQGAESRESRESREQSA